MAILNSKQLWAERNRLAEEQRRAVDDKNQDKALIIQGQIEQIDSTLNHVLDEEDALRHMPKPKAQNETFGMRILGARDEFHGLELGFKTAAERNETTVVSVTGPKEIELELPMKLPTAFENFASTLLETPAAGSISYKQRDKSNESGGPDTWGGVTSGNSATKAQVIYAWKDAVANKETIAGYVPVSKDTLLDYDELLDIIEHDLLLDLDAKTNAKNESGGPDTWGGVTSGNSATKAQVIYAWKDAVANKETIAGYVPVSKDTLMDYDELLDIIEHDLLLDLDAKTNAKYWNGNSGTGIKGIENTVGIQAFETHMGGRYFDAIRMMRTKVMTGSRRVPTHVCVSPEVREAIDLGIQAFETHMGGRYFDAIRMMRTKVMTGSRRVPTHVCVSPEVREAIDLYKTETGLYQTLGSDVYWGMKVIEDESCPGILVYDSFAARRRAIHGGTTVELGYYNDQFIKNELSILAEHTKALQVRYPDAFCLAKKADLDQAAA